MFVQHTKKKTFNSWNIVIFQDREKMRLKINDSEILWPGRLKRKPEGFFIPTHLKVLTIEEKPFVYSRRKLEEEESCEEDEILCPHFNSTDGAGKSIENVIEIHHDKRCEHLRVN